jgi:hypothetical protein
MPETQVDPTTLPPADPPGTGEPPPETDWKAEARKWEQRAKDNKKQLDEAQPKLSEYDKWAEASKTELERKNEEVTRWQTEAERWRSASVGNRIEALASNLFADPTDATAALAAEPSKYLGVDGVMNDDAIRADLEAVLERKPHWRRQDNPSNTSPPSRLPAPNPAQGSGGGKPAQNPADEFAAILQAQISRD